MQFDKYPNYHRFLGKNLLGIDYGTKNVGLALYCPGTDPAPYAYKNTPYLSDQKTVEMLKQVAKQEQVDVVVLGIPFLPDGGTNRMTEKVRRFGLLLQSSNLATFFEQDEVYSSQTARERMTQSARYNFKVDLKWLDALSAAIILEQFIQSLPDTSGPNK